MSATSDVTARRLYVACAALLGLVAPPAGGGVAAAWPPFCPDPCVCGMRTTPGSRDRRRAVECANAGMTSPPANVSGDVEMMLLASNRIRLDRLDPLADYGNLTEVDLAENHLYGLGDVRVTLTSLLCLILDGNELDYLANKSFWWTPNLRRLSVRRNKIELIHADAFAGLAELRMLALSANRLFAVVPEWFGDLAELRELDLSDNNIHVVREGAFRRAGALTALDVGRNQLQHVYDGAFAGLRSLRAITLQDNSLSEFPLAALGRMSGLRRVNLNRNPLRALYAGSVANLAVSVLLMSHMDRLRFVDRRSFANLTQLSRLELHDNKLLNYIDPEAFHGVPRLQSLLLQNNNLSVVEEKMLYAMPALEEINLAGNSLFCDCNLRWLIREIPDRARNLTIPDADRLTCEAPSSLRGAALKDVDVDGLPVTCAPRILPLYALEYTIDLGDPLRLNCRAVGRPEPQTDWLLPARSADRGGDGGVVVLKTGSRRGAGVRSIADHVAISPAGTLSVHYARAADSGRYTCLASNPRGRDERSARLVVRTNLADVIVLGATRHSVTVTWRSRSHEHAYRIMYRRGESNATYRTVDVEPYMRSFTANDLAAGAEYEFCIAMRQGAAAVRINCTTAYTRRDEYTPDGLFNARNFIVGGAAGCFALLMAVVCSATHFIRRYNRRKRAQEELYSDNLSQLFLASMDSMSEDTTPITYENTGAEMFDDDDIEEIRSTASMPGCSTYTTIIK